MDTLMKTNRYLKLWSVILVAVVMSLSASAQRLPKLTLTDIRGNSVCLDTLCADGRPVIVDVFATWCHPCLRELAAIHEVWDDWQAEANVRLVAIAIDEGQNASKVRPLADSNGWKWQVLLDPNSQLIRALGIQSIPYVMVLDGKGNIAYKHLGYTDGAEEELLEKVKELSAMKEKKPAARKTRRK